MSPSELFLKIATLPVVLTAGFVFVAFSALFFTLNPTHAIEARFKEALNHDLYFNTSASLYGPRKLYAMLDAYAAADYRAHYKSLLIDFIYPVTYAAALGLLIVYLQNHFRTADATITEYPVLIPLLAALFDYLENVSIYFILRRHQMGRARAATALVYFSSLMTALKITLSVASVLIIIAGLLRLILE